MTGTLSIGARGEEAAVNFLRKQGFNISSRNFRTRWGEIDIIAQKDDTTHFIEVKTRLSEVGGQPYEAVNFVKILHLMRASDVYLLQNDIKHSKLSLDVVSIVYNNSQKDPDITFFENISS